MTFQSPYLLWLLVPLLLLFSWELARHATRSMENWPRIVRAWAGAFSVSLGAQHTTAENRPRLWLWFGLACCIVALARPQWGVIEEQVFDQSREVLIAVDLSKSMLAQDVKPSRLDRAKLLIQSLLDRLRGERVGLVLFSGSAFLQSPLSADYEILREFLPALQPDYLPEGGSNYRAMLEAAIEAFGTSTADRYLIILSDGESTEESWKELTNSLRDKGIRVIGLGIGTSAGAFIPDEAGGFVKDERGAVVMSRLNSSTLQELAQVTGGAYTDASAWVDLPALLARTVETGRKGEFSEKNTARMIERYQWFLAPGLLLLFLSFWSEFPVRPRERALPLAPAAPRSERRNAERGMPKPATATVSSWAVFLWLTALGAPHSAPAQASPPPAPVDTAALTKPLATVVTRLAVKDQLTAKDLAELAETTVTYGQRMHSAQQPPVEGAIRDALLAVDRGEKLDPKAADWPKLRRELEEMLKKQEPPPQDEQQNQEEDQEDQQQDQQQQPQDQQKQDQSKSEQPQPPQDQQQKQQDEQSAFGDMEEKKEQPKQEPKPQPQSGTQKVGGQQEQKQAEQDPELTLPLQKLDQVRDQDSPAKLYQLLQGRKEEPKKKGKDW